MVETVITALKAFCSLIRVAVISVLVAIEMGLLLLIGNALIVPRESEVRAFRHWADAGTTEAYSAFRMEKRKYRFLAVVESAVLAGNTWLLYRAIRRKRPVLTHDLPN